MNEQRQQRLAPILADLKVEGVGHVHRDDYDSTAVDVFVYLVECMPTTSGGRTRKFVKHLNSYYALFRRVCKKHGVDYAVLDYPQMKYETYAGEKYPMGYDVNAFKLEIFV